MGHCWKGWKDLVVKPFSCLSGGSEEQVMSHFSLVNETCESYVKERSCMNCIFHSSISQHIYSDMKMGQ